MIEVDLETGRVTVTNETVRFPRDLVGEFKDTIYRHCTIELWLGQNITFRNCSFLDCALVGDGWGGLQTLIAANHEGETIH